MRGVESLFNRLLHVTPALNALGSWVSPYNKFTTTKICYPLLVHILMRFCPSSLGLIPIDKESVLHQTLQDIEVRQ